MISFTTKICLILGCLTWNGVHAEETSTRAEMLAIAEQVETLSRDIQELITSVTKKVPQLETLRLASENDYWEMLEKTGEMMISTRNCEPLKNNFQMMTTNIRTILKQCFQRAMSFVQGLFSRVTSLRSKITNDFRKWTIIALHPHSDGNNTDDFLTQIESTRKALARLQSAKQIKEMETNVSMKICRSVADSYEEESRNLLGQIKECLFPQSTDQATESVSSKVTSEPTSERLYESTDGGTNTERLLENGWGFWDSDK